ncbi:HAMP domain-containing sensor histidine kinase [Sphingobium sp. AP49]|uniref:sensor histidine kinase n=1 Tax=Sphingobium sp. AP49 TaxID=1144307 RepID=UPI00026EE30C|nr:HAMP domain-containing sensor histidine kinase [Sphingobium sp. AP49]WHO37645.1 HAMP domain-containing sensor histidine kinase [Sphingobium sp. AP49]
MILLPRTIKGLSILSAAVSGLVILILGAAAILISHHEIEAQMDHRIEREMDALLDFHASNGAAQLAQVVRGRDGAATGGTGYLADTGSDGRMMLYALADATGRRIAGRLIPDMPPDGWSEFLPIRHPDGSKGEAQALSRRLPDGGQLVIAADRSALHRADDRILFVVLMGLGVILLTGTLSTIAFGRLVRRRLVLISGTAQGIIEGDYARRVPVDGSGSEFDRISAILNQMLGRIEELMSSLRQVSSDLAHDMRTPLGRIRQDMERLARDTTDLAAGQAVEQAIVDIDALLDLFAGLLGVSEVRGFAARKRFVSLPLAEIVGDVTDAYRPAFDDDGRILSADLQPVAIRGDAQLLKRAIANLLENVLAHAGNGAGASVSLRHDAGQAILTVADDGKGVPTKDLETIFERLVRLDPSRSKGGHGLGLSMVRAIVHAHHGRIRAESSTPGLRFLIQFPIDHQPFTGEG